MGAPSFAAQGPCDIYQSGGTPCVAAHSTTRALYGAYSGILYQVRRTSDGKTQDIGLLVVGGEAKSSVQDEFCANTTCTISKIYDQSPKGNHLVVAPVGGWLKTIGLEAGAKDAKIMLNGRTVYGVYTRGNGFTDKSGVGYRNNKTEGVPVGDAPQGIYMVAGGKHYNAWCCFDYGNAGTTNEYEGPATMETIYFGNSTQWGKGSGEGPWVMADLEAGLFAGVSFDPPASNVSLKHDYITAMVKGDSGNHFAIRGGNAQSGSLLDLYDGKRPTGYSPMKKKGAIVLGVGGDNSNTGEGTFFEGAIVAGYPTVASDNAVQANVVAAGYGRTTPSRAMGDVGIRTPASLRYDPKHALVHLDFTTETSGAMTVRVVDLRGREVARLMDGEVPSGRHEAIWNAQARSGLYVLVMEVAGSRIWSGSVILEH